MVSPQPGNKGLRCAQDRMSNTRLGGPQLFKENFGMPTKKRVAFPEMSRHSGPRKLVFFSNNKRRGIVKN